MYMLLIIYIHVHVTVYTMYNYVLSVCLSVSFFVSFFWFSVSVSVWFFVCLSVSVSISLCLLSLFVYMYIHCTYIRTCSLIVFLSLLTSSGRCVIWGRECSQSHWWCRKDEETTEGIWRLEWLHEACMYSFYLLYMYPHQQNVYVLCGCIVHMCIYMCSVSPKGGKGAHHLSFAVHTRTGFALELDCYN